MANLGMRRVLVAAACLIGTGGLGLGAASAWSLDVPMKGAECVPAVETGGSGTAALTYDPATRQLAWKLTYSGLSAPATMAHFHGPAARGKNAPVAVWLNKQGTPPANPITGEATLTPEQAQQFTAGEWYVNLHTQSHPACEIRGYITPPKS